MAQQKLNHLKTMVQQWLSLAQKNNLSVSPERLIAMQNLHKILQQQATPNTSDHQEVEVIVDFIPQWLLLFNKGMSPIHQVDLGGKPTPINLRLSPDQLPQPLVKGESYQAVAFKEYPKENKRTTRASTPFQYDGSPELLVQIMNKVSKGLEEELELSQKEQKQVNKLRERIIKLSLNKLEKAQKIVQHNTDIMVDDFARYWEIIAEYPATGAEWSAHRKVFAAVSSSFTDAFIQEGGKKVIRKAVDTGIITFFTGAGTAVAPVYGTIVGFGIGVVVDVFVNMGLETYVFSSTAEDDYEARSNKIREHVEAQKETWKADVQQEIDEFFDALQAVNSDIFKIEDIKRLQDIHQSIKDSPVQGEKLKKGQYLNPLLKNWTFTRAGDDGDDPSNGTNEIAWTKAVEKLQQNNVLPTYKGEEGNISNQVDVYLYQLRGLWPKMGLTCGFLPHVEATHKKHYDYITTLLTKGPSTDQERLDYSDIELESNGGCAPFDKFFQLIKPAVAYRAYNEELKVSNEQQFLNMLTLTMHDSKQRKTLKLLIARRHDERIKYTILWSPQLVYTTNSIFMKSLNWTLKTHHGGISEETRITGSIMIDNDG